MYIIKRDGKKEEFNKEKISNAIYKSMVDAGEINEDARIKIIEIIQMQTIQKKGQNVLQE